MRHPRVMRIAVAFVALALSACVAQPEPEPEPADLVEVCEEVAECVAFDCAAIDAEFAMLNAEQPNMLEDPEGWETWSAMTSPVLDSLLQCWDDCAGLEIPRGYHEICSQLFPEDYDELCAAAWGAVRADEADPCAPFR